MSLLIKLKKLLSEDVYKRPLFLDRVGERIFRFSNTLRVATIRWFTAIRYQDEGRAYGRFLDDVVKFYEKEEDTFLCPFLNRPDCPGSFENKMRLFGEIALLLSKQKIDSIGMSGCPIHFSRDLWKVPSGNFSRGCRLRLLKAIRGVNKRGFGIHALYYMVDPPSADMLFDEWLSEMVKRYED